VHPEGRERPQLALRQGVVGHGRGLRELERQLGAGQAVPLQGGQHVARQPRPGELPAGDVDRHAAGQVHALVPQGHQLGARGVQHSSAHGHDERGGLEGRQEGQRRQDPQLGVLPPQEGLHLVRPPGAEVDERLVAGHELAVLERPRRRPGSRASVSTCFAVQAVQPVAPTLLEQEDDLLRRALIASTWAVLNCRSR
jgi:hypothetical protein